MENDVYLTTLKPQNNLLKKWIAYYYFHSSDNEQHNEAFHFYPNYLHALTIYKGNDVEINTNNKTSQITASADHKKLTFLYTINSKDKYYVEMKGAFFKIGIVFYPLGINHFIDRPLSELMHKNAQEISFNEQFENKISSISKKQPITEQIALLEEALLTILRPFEEKQLQKAIKEIVLSNGTIKVEELEKQTATNRKTLLRLFKKHTLTTIEEYKKMVMFRNSLNYALQNKELSNLTDVALFNMYYDQSHFIKHFKSFTQETPKTLLPKIKQIGNEDLYWYFLKE